MNRCISAPQPGSRFPAFAVPCVLVFTCVLASLPARGQEQSSNETGEQIADGVTEEIVVRGGTPAALRFQIERAEDAIYERFNEINSTDDFDIFCRDEVPTGSRMRHRVCKPRFWQEAQSQAGTETARTFQGSYAMSVAVINAEALYKNELMDDELRQLAASDAQLLDAIVKLERLRTTLENYDDAQNDENATRAFVATADEYSLPYDAAVMAEVRVRSGPFSHVLTHPTFAVANVFGEIDSIELYCRNQTHRLQFEPGAEWSVPADWEPCYVEIDARRDTTFSLFEFD